MSAISRHSGLVRCCKKITCPILPLNFFTNFKEIYHEYEYSDRTHTGNCDRGINFVGTEVFKLFRGCIFDRRRYLGVDAPHYHHVREETKTQGHAVLEWFSV